MLNNKFKFFIIFYTIIFICSLYSGCIDIQNSEKDDMLFPDLISDQCSILPDWKDGEYHDYYKTTDMLNSLNENYPNLIKNYSQLEAYVKKLHKNFCKRFKIKFNCPTSEQFKNYFWDSGYFDSAYLFMYEEDF